MNAPAPPLTVAQQRAIGHARISVRQRAGRTRLAGLRQEGSAKILLPRTQGIALQAVLLNTAGGITGGDWFGWTGEAGPETHLSLSSQAAERAYRARPGETGHVTTRLRIAEGARLDWLPQETILFDGAALSRRLEADLAPDATLLAVEPLIFGRKAMGEVVHDLRLTDQWRIRRGGDLVYADALRVHGDAAAILSGPATLAGMRAMASLALIAPEAERLLAPLRAALPATAGASLIRPGVLAARIAAPDGLVLRRALMRALPVLAPLPKVWSL